MITLKGKTTEELLEERLSKLIKERERVLNMSVLSKVTSANGDVHLLCHRKSDSSFIVWTTFRLDDVSTSYDNLYNGCYDLTVEEALRVIESRVGKQNCSK